MSDWSMDAACAQTDPEAFFPEKGGSIRAAKETCATCPVKAECLEYALDEGIWDGIWGGLSVKERRDMARGRGTRSRAQRVADERARWARLATLRGVLVEDIANHLGVDERTVSRYTSEDAA